MTVCTVVGVALLSGDQVLAARRSDGGWEFPGGKVEEDETPEAAAAREIDEELGCRVAITGWLGEAVPIRDGLELRVATAHLVDGEPVPRPGEHDALRWLRVDQLGEVAWLPADQPFVGELTVLLS